MRAAAVHSPLRSLIVQESVNQPRCKRVTAADAVEYLKVGHRPRLGELALVVADRAPIIDCGRLGVTQCRGHHFEVMEGRDSLLDHLAKALRLQLAQWF